MPKIKVNDINLYYETYGQGEPIVFIAGFSVDHLVWQPVIDRFAEKYQVIVFDNRGSGQSDSPNYPYTMEMFTEDTIGLCKALDIKSAHFVGSSMGGKIVQLLAYKYAEFMKSGIIVNSDIKLDKKFTTFCEGKYKLMQIGSPAHVLAEISIPWVFSSYYLEKPNILETLIAITVNNPYPFTLQSYHNQFNALRDFDSRQWLKNITKPCLITGSDDDIICGEPTIREMANLIPNATYYGFKNCGHVPFIEKPELFCEVVLDFLAKQHQEITQRAYVD